MIKTMQNHVVFFHQNYPAQFGPITRFLVRELGAKVSFFSEFISREPDPEITHYPYQPDKSFLPEKPFFFSRYFEQECRSMFGVYQALEKAQLVSPDVFVGHVGFGNLGLLHVAYPQVPTVGFFEIYYDPFWPETYCRPGFPVPKPNVLRMPLRNATHLIELEYCTRGYSPTPFQRSTFPKRYHDKLAVIFDGIDTHLYQPGEPAGHPELKRTWPEDAKIVTYVSRGLEMFRGFDVFMEMAHKLSQIRSDVHFIIAGKSQTHYGSESFTIKEPTFKEYVMKRHPYDLSRYHFFEWLSEPALVDLLRLSDCHFYWTIPFTLSWSFFQSLSTGALVVASKSPPVQDVLVHGENGLMVEPYDIDTMVELVDEVLSQPERYAPLREAARETIVSHYSFEVCLPKLADFYLGKVPASVI